MKAPTKIPAPITERQPVQSVKPAPQDASVTGSESTPENNNTHNEGTFLNIFLMLL